jgi:hypothetical protein
MHNGIILLKTKKNRSNQDFQLIVVSNPWMVLYPRYWYFGFDKVAYKM